MAHEVWLRWMDVAFFLTSNDNRFKIYERCYTMIAINF